MRWFLELTGLAKLSARVRGSIFVRENHTGAYRSFQTATNWVQLISLSCLWLCHSLGWFHQKWFQPSFPLVRSFWGPLNLFILLHHGGWSRWSKSWIQNSILKSNLGLCRRTSKAQSMNPCKSQLQKKAGLSSWAVDHLAGLFRSQLPPSSQSLCCLPPSLRLWSGHKVHQCALAILPQWLPLQGSKKTCLLKCILQPLCWGCGWNLGGGKCCWDRLQLHRILLLSCEAGACWLGLCPAD